MDQCEPRLLSHEVDELACVCSFGSSQVGAHTAIYAVPRQAIYSRVNKNKMSR